MADNFNLNGIEKKKPGAKYFLLYGVGHVEGNKILRPTKGQLHE